MKALHDQSHYEVLEVRSGASQDEIERAYRMVRATYEDDSLALYSLFGAHEAEVIRDRVDEAHRVLSDPSARVVYDRTRPESAAPGEGTASARGEADGETREPEQLFEEAVERYRELETDVEDEAGEFDGPRLRRARLRRGIEIDHVSDVTKVTPRHLRNIESDNFDDLPPTVYVRGFVKAYARTIGLDPERVAGSYMARFEEAREASGRGRFRARR